MTEVDILKARLLKETHLFFDDLLHDITGGVSQKKLSYYAAKGTLALEYLNSPTNEIETVINYENPTQEMLDEYAIETGISNTNSMAFILATIHKAKYLGMISLVNIVEGAVLKSEDLIDTIVSLNDEIQVVSSLTAIRTTTEDTIYSSI